MLLSRLVYNIKKIGTTLFLFCFMALSAKSIAGPCETYAANTKGTKVDYLSITTTLADFATGLPFGQLIWAFLPKDDPAIGACLGEINARLNSLENYAYNEDSIRFSDIRSELYGSPASNYGVFANNLTINANDIAATANALLSGATGDEYDDLINNVYIAPSVLLTAAATEARYISYIQAEHNCQGYTLHPTIYGDQNATTYKPTRAEYNAVSAPSNSCILPGYAQWSRMNAITNNAPLPNSFKSMLDALGIVVTFGNDGKLAAHMKSSYDGAIHNWPLVAKRASLVQQCQLIAFGPMHGFGYKFYDDVTNQEFSIPTGFATDQEAMQACNIRRNNHVKNQNTIAQAINATEFVRTTINNLHLHSMVPSIAESQKNVNAIQAYDDLRYGCMMDSTWRWSCDLPVTDSLSDLEDECGCLGRTLRHNGTGRYRCDGLPLSCGGKSFVKTLGYDPNLDWYTDLTQNVTQSTNDPYEQLVRNCSQSNWPYSCTVPAVDSITPFTKGQACECKGRVLQHNATGLYRCEILPKSCGKLGGDVSFTETLGYAPNMSWYRDVTPHDIKGANKVRYQNLVNNCKNSSWSRDFSCEIPAVTNRNLLTGKCACKGLTLRHKSTGLYRCEALRTSCGGVSFRENLGYAPNLNWYDVVQ